MIIQQAELRDAIKISDVLIESTSGNIGIALVMDFCAKRLLAKAPDTGEHVGLERQVAIRAYGAELILVSCEKSMEGVRNLAL